MQPDLFGNEDNRVEYFFVISPPPAVVNAVRRFKARLHERIGLDAINMRSMAHISLFKFLKNDNDSLIISKAAAALKHKTIFDIRLRGADSFLHKDRAGTLYIKIAQPDPVNIVTRLLCTAFSLAYRPSIPHLTIARNVPLPSFVKIDPADFDYHYDFICRHITLLKWNGEKYDVIHEAPLNDTAPA
ncbi:2'-5' RNA ligase family protein [Chitinophaga lutea]|nr:2'-5' RNA ligase family protein [Chitinophaga lutea]